MYNQYYKFNINIFDIKNDLITFKSNFNLTNYLKLIQTILKGTINFKSIRDQKNSLPHKL